MGALYRGLRAALSWGILRVAPYSVDRMFFPLDACLDGLGVGFLSYLSGPVQRFELLFSAL